MRLGLTRQHLAVSSAAEVIRVIRPKTDEEVVVALRRALIPYSSLSIGGRRMQDRL